MTFEEPTDDTTGETTPPAPGTAQTPDVTAPKYVTEDVLKAELVNFGKSQEERMANLFRGIQSQNDKLQDRVNKKVAAIEQVAQQQGYVLSPAQKQKLVDDTTLAELQSPSNAAPSTANPVQDKPAGETEDEFAKQVNVAAETLWKVAKITLEDGDPEVELVNKAAEGNDAEAYLEANKEAIRLKKERLSKGGTETPQRTAAGGVPGAISGSPNSNPIANITDRDILWEHVKKDGKIR